MYVGNIYAQCIQLCLGPYWCGNVERTLLGNQTLMPLLCFSSLGVVLKSVSENGADECLDPRQKD